MSTFQSYVKGIFFLSTSIEKYIRNTSLASHYLRASMCLIGSELAGTQTHDVNKPVLVTVAYKMRTHS